VTRDKQVAVLPTLEMDVIDPGDAAAESLRRRVKRRLETAPKAEVETLHDFQMLSNVRMPSRFS
jgi:hypothetical protein